MSSKAITSISNRGVNGNCWSSSLWGEGTNARNLNFNLNNANVNHNDVGNRFPLRFVRVQEYAKPGVRFFSNHATQRRNLLRAILRPAARLPAGLPA